MKTIDQVAKEYLDIAPQLVLNSPNSVKKIKEILVPDGAAIQADEKIIVPEASGQPSVDLYVYRPDTFNSAVPYPALFFIHGDGYLVGTAHMQGNDLKRWANNLNAIVFSVEYRLATKEPYPADLNFADPMRHYWTLCSYSCSKDNWCTDRYLHHNLRSQHDTLWHVILDDLVM